MENNQTFSISAMDAAWLRAEPTTGLKEILDEGRYIFVENHYVLNSKHYVERNEDGSLQLTHYALNHMEECCLIFDLSITNQDVPPKYHTECFLNRDFESTIDFRPEFQAGHATKESQDKALNEFVEETYAFALTLPEDYVTSLKMAIDWIGKLSHSDIEDRDLDNVQHVVGRKTLERCLKGEKVDVKSIVSICISLGLPYKISSHIIKHSPSPLNMRNKARQWYDYVLANMYCCDLLEINKFLKDRGLDSDDLL